MAEVVAIFSADQVCTLARITERQLRYWDKTEFFRPERIDEKHGPFNRVYSFRDVVGLRTIGLLRNRYRVLLSELRKVAQWLHERYAQPWASLKFYVWNKRIYFIDPETGLAIAATTPSGQLPHRALIELTPIASSVTRAVNEMKKRHRKDIGRVSRDRYIAHNALVIAGTRIPVATICRYARAGYTPDQIIAEFPRLAHADIAQALRHERAAS